MKVPKNESYSHSTLSGLGFGTFWISIHVQPFQGWDSGLFEFLFTFNPFRVAKRKTWFIWFQFLRFPLMLKIPYGQSNFKALIQGAFFYQDRTEYIRLMESDSRFLFFLRPRRFGKTLFVSTLRYYYGLEHKALWNELTILWLWHKNTPGFP